ncbi:MAG: AAA family ATPase [Myxococcota bacterium]
MRGRRAFDGMPDPEAYVPRDSTNRCLAELEDWVHHGGPSVAILSGPSGIGKTLMLRLLETRCRGRLECVYLGNPTFGLREFCISILDALKVPHGEAPETTLGRTLESLARQGSGLLLLIDDVELLPTTTESWLRETLLESDPNLAVAMAVVDESHCERLLAMFGREARLVSLDTPMQRMETANFIHSELSRGGVSPEDAARFDENAIDLIHERSEGFPALVQQEAARWLQRAAGPSGTPDRPLTLGSSIVSVGEGVSSGPPVDLVIPLEVPSPRSKRRSTGPAVFPPLPAPGGGDAPFLGARLRAGVDPVLWGIRRVTAAVARGGRHAAQRAAGVARRVGRWLRDIDWTAPVRWLRDGIAAVGIERLKLGGAFVLGVAVTAALGPWSMRRTEAPLAPVSAPPPAAVEDPITFESAVATVVELPAPAPARERPPEVEAPPPAEPEVAAEAAPAESAAAVVAAPPGPVEARPANVEASAPVVREVPAAEPAAAQAPPAPERERVAKAVPEEPAPARPARAQKPPGSAPERVAAAEPVAVAAPPAPVLVGVNARPWATIWLDGRELGETPLAEIPVRPGTHRFAAVMPDGRRIERTVEISAENRYLRFE